jgi:Helix-turn-helix domain
MPRVMLEAYVVDVLMPDLIGHDHRPAAFIVYLYLLRHSRPGSERVAVSLQSIATRTGLSKSAVQSAIRHLKRRRLLDPDVHSTVVAPVQRVLRPWLRRRD